MIGALTALLSFQLTGELIARLSGAPIPGPVIGMLLLLAFFVARGGMSDQMRTVASTVVQHLSLLFVPAGVGLMLHATRIAGEWLVIGAALIGSTVLTLVVTVLVFRLCAGRAPDREGERGGEGA